MWCLWLPFKLSIHFDAKTEISGAMKTGALKPYVWLHPHSLPHFSLVPTLCIYFKSCTNLQVENKKYRFFVGISRFHHLSPHYRIKTFFVWLLCVPLISDSPHLRRNGTPPLFDILPFEINIENYLFIYRYYLYFIW